MRRRRPTIRALLLGAAAAAAVTVLAAQAPPINAGVVGWLQALYNQLSDGGNGNPRTQVTASSTGTTGAVTATLPAAAGKTTYLCSVQIGEAGSSTATATATNTITGTLNYVVTAPGNFTITYSPCVAANAANTTIPVATAANASATAVAVTATGYQR